MKQTAVEWLLEELTMASFDQQQIAINKAKEMEKQQQGYSEEDMKECWMVCLGFNKPEKFNSRVKFEQWFEQFKKK